MEKPVQVIRYIATSWDGHAIAAAEHQWFVHLYDLKRYGHICSFESTMDAGGDRLAISADGSTVVAGAYRVFGIAGYSGVDGSELWRRRDLKKVQRLRFNRDASGVFCCFDSRPCARLSPVTGELEQSFRGVRRIWESPFGPIRFEERTRGADYALMSFEKPIARISRLTFAALSATFSPKLVCVSEATGLVRAFDVTSGEEVWRHVPPNGTHFLRVAYCEKEKAFVGVSWEFQGGKRVLLQRFWPTDESASVIADVGPAIASAFCMRGSLLVTAFGEVVSVATGKQVGLLPFPKEKTWGT